jgi:AraC family transcriptional regulator, arabinose operon regulatory protein
MKLKRWYMNPEQSRSKVMAVRGLAIQEPMPPMIVDRAAPGDFLLMHFHSPAVVLAGGDILRVAPHTLYIWPPGQRQYYGNAENPWLHSWIHCDGVRVPMALETAGVALERPLQLTDAHLSEKYMRTLYDEMSSFVEPDPLILEGILTLWMRELARATQGSPLAGRIPARLIGVRQFIDTDPSREMTLDMLAGKAALSVTQFSVEFRRYFGTSPMNYVLRVRMHKAMHHLTDQGLNITEIARLCGFNDPFYFSKQFRKHFGKCPREYRKARTKLATGVECEKTPGY